MARGLLASASGTVLRVHACQLLAADRKAEVKVATSLGARATQSSSPDGVGNRWMDERRLPDLCRGLRGEETDEGYPLEL